MDACNNPKQSPKTYYNLLYELVNNGQKTFLAICTFFYRGTALPLFCPHSHGQGVQQWQSVERGARAGNGRVRSPQRSGGLQPRGPQRGNYTVRFHWGMFASARGHCIEGIWNRWPFSRACWAVWSQTSERQRKLSKFLFKMNFALITAFKPSCFNESACR